jgi:hypothetical protein
MSQNIPRTQKAAVVESHDAPIRIKDDCPVKQPEDLAAGECLLKMHCTGVCHTDLHARMGDWPLPCKLPLIGGHEGVGEVVAIGAHTVNSPVKIGDRVGVKWLADSCLQCEQCRKGLEQSVSLPYTPLIRPDVEWPRTHSVSQGQTERIYSGRNVLSIRGTNLVPTFLLQHYIARTIRCLMFLMSHPSQQTLAAKKRPHFSAQCVFVLYYQAGTYLIMACTGCHRVPCAKVQPNQTRRLDCYSWCRWWSWTSWFAPSSTSLIPSLTMHLSCSVCSIRLWTASYSHRFVIRVSNYTIARPISHSRAA